MTTIPAPQARTPLIEILDRLDGLSKLAAADPWRWSTHGADILRGENEVVLSSEDVYVLPENARLITTLRNSWPQVSAALRAAIKWLQVQDNADCCGPDNECYGECATYATDAREAFRRLVSGKAGETP